MGDSLFQPSPYITCWHQRALAVQFLQHLSQNSILPSSEDNLGEGKGKQGRREGQRRRYNLQWCFSPWTLDSPQGTEKVNMMLIRAAKYTAVMWEGIIWLGSSFHPLQKKPQTGISSTAVSILVSNFFMLHIYSSIKYSVLLLLPSPIQEATLSLFPCARKRRQTFDPHISTFTQTIILLCSSRGLQEKPLHSSKNWTENWQLPLKHKSS